ncbi:MAG: site-2 protease family protein [Candidatus Diapherotrites archaeon]|uniref:Site-2 protease family protein n=1 Tax=Candidatus Iainarchaeum sp. TaxID=3101447 RepID=A0A8T4C730_9ARCH|nr:site-2 protease family protein [Candidatus Diapherotrites archaeon]
MSIQNQELTDLLISWISLSAAFAFVFSDGGLNVTSFGSALAIAALAVGTGFLMHELAHKYVAIHFGAKAEYRAWNLGLIVALAFAIFGGFIFAAPGAVYIFGKKVSVKENGIISLAGPLMNIVVGLVSFLAAGMYASSQIGNVAAVVGSINFYLAMFNLLPFFVLDGAKVFAWNKIVWGILFFPLVAFLFFV